jgi:hypothetical protein
MFFFIVVSGVVLVQVVKESEAFRIGLFEIAAEKFIALKEKYGITDNILDKYFTEPVEYDDEMVFGIRLPCSRDIDSIKANIISETGCDNVICIPVKAFECISCGYGYGGCHVNSLTSASFTYGTGVMGGCFQVRYIHAGTPKYFDFKGEVGGVQYIHGEYNQLFYLFQHEIAVSPDSLFEDAKLAFRKAVAKLPDGLIKGLVMQALNHVDISERKHVLVAFEDRVLMNVGVDRRTRYLRLIRCDDTYMYAQLKFVLLSNEQTLGSANVLVTHMQPTDIEKAVGEVTGNYDNMWIPRAVFTTMQKVRAEYGYVNYAVNSFGLTQYAISLKDTGFSTPPFQVEGDSVEISEFNNMMKVFHFAVKMEGTNLSVEEARAEFMDKVVDLPDGHIKSLAAYAIENESERLSKRRRT